MTYNAHQVRQDFPYFAHHDVVYLDNAATTHKPASVIDGMAAFYRSEYATIHRGIYTSATLAAEKYAGVREQVARFIHAESSREIVFVRSTTEAINLVAHTFPRTFMEAGDEILITELEHHANIVPWQMIAKERGLTLKYVPLKEGAIDMEAFRSLITSKTKLLSVAHISNVTGAVHPVREMIELAHSKGAKVLIDGAQAAGHQKIDVQKLGADFYVFSGHKMYGPTGIGVLYGKYDLLKKLPPYQTGGDMIENVTMEESTFQEPPTRFETGTPLLAEVVGLGLAIEYIEGLGIKNIHNHEQYLLELAHKKLAKVPGLKILGDPQKEKGAVISFVIEGCHPLDVATFLNLRGVCVRSGHLCAQPGVRALGYESVLRASFSAYTLPEEIDSLVNALEASLVIYTQ